MALKTIQHKRLKLIIIYKLSKIISISKKYKKTILKFYILK